MFKKKHRGKINLQAPNHKTSINCKKMEENLTKTISAIQFVRY